MQEMEIRPMTGQRRTNPGPTAGEPTASAARARYRAFMAGNSGEDETRMQLDSYKAEILPIDPSMRNYLHELTVSVFWPHRDRDLDFFLSLGQGYIALDEIGRPLGSAMYFEMGDDFAMCGLMVTTPRLQAQGAGRRLLRRVLRDCEGRDLRLSATREGYRLYEAAGFTPVNTIWQHQGIARPIHLPAPVPGLEIRALTGADHAALRALDLHAYGAERKAVLDALLADSTGVVAVRDGKVCGYALKRRFGKGVVVGPVVAGDRAQAMNLAAPLIQRCEGQFCRLDTPLEDYHFAAFLASAGLGMFDTVTEMYLGRQRRPAQGAVAVMYGLAAQSLG